MGKFTAVSKESPVAVSNTPRSNSLDITDHPEACGPALAQVVQQVDGGADVLLGQAWLAAPNRMVTCGHVVDRFVPNPGALWLIFPASGNRYQVRAVRMHPSFVRQRDGLVKFDVAVLDMNLVEPESRIQPLPFSYESALKTNQTLGTIRYPVHLGQFSAALQPLTQEGRYLGLLRKHDNFHMLHDLPLSPGDSGSPLCSGNRVVAIHCGDTASLPGLNLPTTSIRLALWVDALRELGLRETRGYFAGGSPLMVAMVAGLISLLVAFAAASWYMLSPIQHAWKLEPAGVSPVQVSLNAPIKGYKSGQDVEFTVVPLSTSYVWMFEPDPSGDVYVVHPPKTISARLRKNEPRRIDSNVLGLDTFVALPGDDKIHVVVLDAAHPRADALAKSFLNQSDWVNDKQQPTKLKLKASEVFQRLKTLQQEGGEHVIHQVMDSPGPPP